MKTMKCKDLGGPQSCQVEFKAETFDEIAKQSHQHGSEMFEKKDQDHIQAGMKMKELMQSGKMQEWFEQKKQEFEKL